MGAGMKTQGSAGMPLKLDQVLSTNTGPSRRDLIAGIGAVSAGLALSGRAFAQSPLPRLNDPSAAPGQYKVAKIEDVWTDAARGGRAIPWRLHLPEGLTKPAPVVIYSHGGGGTRETGAQWSEHLASHGFACLHPQHAGSDRDAFRSNRQQISEAARNPTAGKVRFEDIGFTYRQIAGLASQGAAAGRIDPARVGIAGHSFGAITSQIIAGQFVTGFDQSLALPQIKGALALSPSPPRAAYGDASTAFRDMFMPIFHMTGTKDDAPNGDFDAAARRIPFDRTKDVDQWLLILDGANHFTFGGDPNPRLMFRDFSYPDLPRHHDIIRAGSLLFWRMILNGDAKAKDALDGGAFKALLAPSDRYELYKAKA